MTFEKSCTIEPSDILALVYECGTCGASTRIPIDKIARNSLSDHITKHCRQCGAASGISLGTLEYETIVNFSEVAKNLAETSKGRNLKIKMELKCSDLDAKS